MPVTRKRIATAVVVGLVLAAIVLLAGGCATTGKPRCNPIMVQCNPADVPPLTEMLPKSPIPPPLSSWHDNELIGAER